MVSELTPKDMPLGALAAQCAVETDRFFQERRHDPRICFELFRRAIAERDERAWSHVYTRYRPIVASWVQRHPSLRGCGEEPQYFVNRAFERMWSALTPAKFEGFRELGSLLKYLQMCVHSVILDHVRRAEQATVGSQVKLSAIAGASSGQDVEQQSVANIDRHSFWEAVVSRLHSEQERCVVLGSFCLALKPREVCDQYQGVFQDVREVYRVKENVLARLRRDKELWRLLTADA